MQNKLISLVLIIVGTGLDYCIGDTVSPSQSRHRYQKPSLVHRRIKSCTSTLAVRLHWSSGYISLLKSVKKP